MRAATSGAHPSLVAFSGRVLALATLVAGAPFYVSLARDLATAWRDDHYYAYAIIVPVFSAYAWWTSRHELGRCAPRPGAALVAAFAALVLVTGLAVDSLSARSLAIPLAATAIILALHGVDALRRLAFPVGFLLFLVPVPHEVITLVSPAFQRLAAAAAELSLMVLGIPVQRAGLELYIGGDTLEITEACNGLRFLLTMGAIGVALAWAAGRSVASRIAIVLLALGTAIGANIGRVTAVAVLTHLLGVAAATGPAHLVYGKVVYALFGLMLFVTLWLVGAVRAGRRAPSTTTAGCVR